MNWAKLTGTLTNLTGNNNINEINNELTNQLKKKEKCIKELTTSNHELKQSLDFMNNSYDMLQKEKNQLEKIHNQSISEIIRPYHQEIIQHTENLAKVLLKQLNEQTAVQIGQSIQNSSFTFNINLQKHLTQLYKQSREKFLNKIQVENKLKEQIENLKKQLAQKQVSNEKTIKNHNQQTLLVKTEFSTKIDKLLEQTTKKTEEKDRISEQLIQTKEKLKSMAQNLTSLKIAQQKKQKQFFQKCEVNKNLSQQIENNKKQIALISKQKNSLQVQISDLKQINKKIKKICAEQITYTKGVRKEINHLQNTINEVKESINIQLELARQQFQQLLQKISTQQSQKIIPEQNHLIIQNQVQANQLVKNQEQIQANIVDIHNQEIHTQLANITNQLNKQQILPIIQATSVQIKSIQQQRLRYQLNIAQLRSGQLLAQIDALENRLMMLEKDRQELIKKQEHIAKLQGQIFALNSNRQLQNLQNIQQLNTRNEQINKLRDQIVKLREENIKISLKIIQGEVPKQQQKNSNEQLISIEKHNEQKQQLNDLIKKLSGQNEQYIKKMQSISNQNDTLKNQIQSFQNEKKQFIQKFQNIYIQIQADKSQNLELKKQILSLTTEKQKTFAQLQKLTQQKTTLLTALHRDINEANELRKKNQQQLEFYKSITEDFQAKWKQTENKQKYIQSLQQMFQQNLNIKFNQQGIQQIKKRFEMGKQIITQNQQQMKQYSLQLENLSDINKSLQNKIQEFQNVCQDKELKIEYLSKQLQDQLRKYRKLEQESGNKHQALLNQLGQKQKQQMNQLKSKLNKKQSQVGSLAGKIKQIEQKKNYLQKQLEQQRKSTNKKQEQINKKMQSFQEEISIQKEKLQKEVIKLRQQLEKNLTHNALQISKIKQQQSQRLKDTQDVFKAQQYSLEKRTNTEILKLKEQIASLQKQLLIKQEEITNQKNSLFDERKNNAKLNAQLSAQFSSNSKYTQLEAYANELNQKLQTKDQEMKKLYNNMVTMKSTISDLEQGIQTYQSYAQEKNRENQQIKENLNTYQSKLNKAQEQISNYKRNLQQKHNLQEFKQKKSKTVNQNQEQKQPMHDHLRPVKQLILKYFQDGATYDQKAHCLDTLCEVLKINHEEQQKISIYKRRLKQQKNTWKQQKKEQGLQNKLFDFLTAD